MSARPIPEAFRGDAAVSKTAEQGSSPCRGAIASAFREFATSMSEESLSFAFKAKAQGDVGGLVDIAVAEALMKVAKAADRIAKARGEQVQS